MTPAKYVEVARVQAARPALADTLDGVDTVATRCPETMRHSLHRHIGIGPADHRARFSSVLQLARELAAETGETLTEAVVTALRERLDREHARQGTSMRMRLARLAADVAALPVANGRTPEDIIGYDDAGLPS